MQEIRLQLINEMLNFITGDAEALYTRGHVKRCNELLEQFEQAMQPGISEDTALAEIKSLVLALNQLNDDSLFSLIEGPVSDDIRSYVAAGLVQAGIEHDGDATQRWCDW